MSLTPEQIAEIVDGTKSERCDYGQHWHTFSSARVMGWCTARSPVPDLPPMMLLLTVNGADHVSAYNQVCAAYRPEPSHD